MILLKNGNIVLENSVITADILIEKDKIKKIGKLAINETNKLKIINASNKYIFPGAIDPHTHHELNLGKDRMSSDTFESGTCAALNGGVIIIFDFVYQEVENEILV